MRINIKDDGIRRLFFEKVKEQLQLSWKEIGIKHNIPKSTFEHYRSGHLTIPKIIFEECMRSINNKDKIVVLENIEELQENFGQVKGGRKAYILNFEKFKEGRIKGSEQIKKKKELEVIDFSNVVLNEKICEFIGAFIGDGCFNSYKNKLYHIEFAGDSRYDLDYYENIIIPAIKSIIPDIKPHVYYPNNKNNAMRIVFYSKNLFIFLKDYVGFIPGKKTFTVSIPKKIIYSNSKMINYTIRGIFDTDGGVFLDKRKSYKSYYPRIVFQTVSETLYNQLKRYLSKYFKLYASSRIRKGSRNSVFVLEIYGIEQFKKWMSLIGFSNKRHINRFAPIAQSLV